MPAWLKICQLTLDRVKSHRNYRGPLNGRTVGTNWYGTVRGTDFWYEILFGLVRGMNFSTKLIGTVRSTDFGPELLLVRNVVRNLVRKIRSGTEKRTKIRK